MSIANKRKLNTESPESVELEGWIDALASEDTREVAMARLAALGRAAQVRVRAGLKDGRWQIRLACVCWLDRHGTIEDVHAAVPLLCDPRARVRVAAVYVVGRRREGVADSFLDAEVRLMERVCTDESIKVRRQAVRMLAFQWAHPQLEGFFQGILDEERDPKLHQAAGFGLWLCRQAAGRLPVEGSRC